MANGAISSKAYLRSCARAMWKEFGGVVVIQITSASDPHAYPHGMWFDRFVGSTMDITGIDFAATPNLFILEDGSVIPIDYAEIVKIVRT